MRQVREWPQRVIVSRDCENIQSSPLLDWGVWGPAGRRACLRQFSWSVAQNSLGPRCLSPQPLSLPCLQTARNHNHNLPSWITPSILSVPAGLVPTMPIWSCLLVGVWVLLQRITPLYFFHSLWGGGHFCTVPHLLLQLSHKGGMGCGAWQAHLTCVHTGSRPGPPHCEKLGCLLFSVGHIPLFVEQ